MAVTLSFLLLLYLFFHIPYERFYTSWWIFAEWPIEFCREDKVDAAVPSGLSACRLNQYVLFI